MMSQIQKYRGYVINQNAPTFLPHNFFIIFLINSAFPLDKTNLLCYNIIAFNKRRHSQVVRHGSAKPLSPSSNLGGASKKSPKAFAFGFFYPSRRLGISSPHEVRWISSRAASRPCISSRTSVYFPAT